MNARARAAWPWWLLLVSLCFSYARLWCSRDASPSDEDYAVLVDQLVQRQRPGDAVAVFPSWSLRPWVQLQRTHLVPISTDAPIEPLDRYRRLWVLVEPDAVAEFHAAFAATLRPNEPVATAGHTTLWLVEAPQSDVVFDARASLTQANVRLLRSNDDAVLTTCVAADRGFTCPQRPQWQRVARERLNVKANGDDVIWAHPPPRDEVLQIHFDDVPTADALVLRAGHTREGARAAAAVQLRVRLDGTPVADTVHAPDFVFSTQTFPLPQSSATHTLDIEILSPNNGGNHFAFDAYLVRRPR